MSFRKLLVAALLLVSAFGVGVLTARRYGPPDAPPDPSPGAGAVVGAAAAQGRKDRRPGLWHRVREAREGGAAAEPGTVEALADLPYLSGYEVAPESSGVLAHDPERAYEGLNLVVSGHAPEAELVDMRGRVLHRWALELADAWPQLAESEELKGFDTFWRRAHLLPNGDLLAIYDGLGMVKLDSASRLVWSHQGREHHDLFVDAAGRIHTLARRRREQHDRLPIDGPIEEDLLVVLSPQGEVEEEVSVLDAFLDSDYASLLGLARRRGDILHTNTIELMDGRFAERHELFEAGNVLVSVPRLNTVAVIDPRRGRVVWALSGMWGFQHQPTVLDSGNLLVFDNTGYRGDSRVLEIDPLTQEIVWDYRAPEGRRFTSYFLGSSQRLPNGNTLVTESTAGRAFEVTAEGEIAWEYVNRHRAGDEGELIASLLEVIRLNREDLDPGFAKGLEPVGEEVSP